MRGLPVFGGIDCATWISEDILLFHRFTGPFPEKIINDSIPTNTTTLALLRAGTLVDTTGTSLEIRALSQDGAYALLADTADGSWKLAKASDFTSFSAPRSISCSEIHCALLGFVPHSDEIFGFQYNPSVSDRYLGLVFVEPKNLTAQLGPSGLPVGTNVFAGNGSKDTDATARLEVIQWGGSPDNIIVVYEFLNTSQQYGVQVTQDYTAAASLRSGEVNWLTDDSTGSQLLGWIP